MPSAWRRCVEIRARPLAALVPAMRSARRGVFSHRVNSAAMIILGFESSCDETGVAAVCTQRGLLAHALHSQIAMHQEYGGVVPELASRDHIRRIVPLTREVLARAGLERSDIGAVAYTAGPGLAGALLVGASVAQSLAWSLGLPAIPIHRCWPIRGPSFPSWPCWCPAGIPS